MKGEAVPAVIVTPRLVLRRWTVDDAGALYRYASDWRVSELALWPRHTSVDMSREVIREYFINADTFAVVGKSGDEAIGCIGFVPHGNEHFGGIAENEREVGYWIGHPFWGRGLIPEALNALAVYSRDSLGLSKLWLTTDARNMNSQRVAEKCGFCHVADVAEGDIVTKVFARQLD
ncbi:MAG: GNAT family N-acetyltransferase [Muribaculaceae bacterium]|nr:GNAT family N-acetyltransferase [Muribaculaceae bacterium]